MEEGKTKDFRFTNDGILCFQWRFCVPNDKELRQTILWEAHANPYAIHPRGNKMYRDVKELNW